MLLLYIYILLFYARFAEGSNFDLQKYIKGAGKRIQTLPTMTSMKATEYYIIRSLFAAAGFASSLYFTYILQFKW